MSDDIEEQEDPNKLSQIEHILCGWPFLLGIVFGGAIGGGCGAVAYHFNSLIMKKEISIFKKGIYILLTSLGGAVLYLALSIILALVFPDIFGGILGE